MPLYARVAKFLRSLYGVAMAHRNPLIRTLCLAIVMTFLCLRAARVWPRTGTIAAAGAAAIATAAVGPVSAFVLLFSGGFLTFAALIHSHSVGIGHRVGAHGYDTPAAENTIEALKILAKADVEGAFDDEHFPYIEFDVQETADGEIVLFHDPTLAAAFPDGGVNVQAWAALREAGVKRVIATVQDLTAEQLGSLHLGGRAGVHVPTLQQFLEACKACGVRRTLAVEVKALRSDVGRQKLLDLMSDYLATHGAALDADPSARARQYRPLGWAGIIAFPHFFAESFGEYGSPQWRRWAGEMRRRRIPARCVHFYPLELTHGATG